MVTCSQVFDADLSHLEDLRTFLLTQVEGLLSRNKIGYLDLAVEEVFVNICTYAYKIPPGRVEVTFTEDLDRVSVQFCDDGVPFDPLAHVEPDVRGSIDDRPQGGLGILLVRRVMDEVHYSRGNGYNRLVLSLRK
nr:ATP-binding protein [uncultured Dethiosulfovibrio sp.]